MKTVTKHYIDGAFVESHGREVMDIINPSNGKVIARVTLADEEDARRAIAAAKRAFVSFRQTTKKERANLLRRLHEVVAARVDDLTAAMVEEYGGVVRFAAPIVQAGANAFLATEKALQELPLARSWKRPRPPRLTPTMQSPNLGASVCHPIPELAPVTTAVVPDRDGMSARLHW